MPHPRTECTVCGVPAQRLAAAGADAGIAAIEFAITVPFVVMLVMALVELAYLLSGGIALQGGAWAAARHALTNQTANGETREQTVRRIITGYVCPAALPDRAGRYCFWSSDMVRLSDDGISAPLVITARVYTSAANEGQAEPYSDTAPANGRYDAGEAFSDVNGNGHWDADMARSGAGGPGDFVFYDIEMPQDVLGPLLPRSLGAGIIWHHASVVVRNEDF